MNDHDYLFKIVLIGNSGVGKSSIITRYTDNTFTDDFISTIGVDFKICTINIDGKIIKLQLWDTAGQERFKSITKSYYRGATAIMIIFDVSDEGSFIDVKKWLNDISNFNVLKILVGNKSDMIRKIDYNSCKTFADENNIEYIEVSAKKSTNIDRLFDILIDMSITYMKNNKFEVNDKIDNNICLLSDNIKKKICCYK